MNNTKKVKIGNCKYLAMLIVIFLLSLVYINSHSSYAIPDKNITIELNKEIINYDIKENSDKYDLEIRNNEKSIVNLGDGKKIAEINGIVEIPDDLNIKIDSSKDARPTTDVFAVNEEFNFDEAEITLTKNSEVSVILHCKEFNYDSFTCDEWESTNIPFKDNGDSITFTVNGFTAYAGGGGNNSNLTIWDSTDSTAKYSTNQVYFFANYTNKTTGVSVWAPARNTYCNISINTSTGYSSPKNMTYNATTFQFQYNTTFNVKGTFRFNVSCDDDNYDFLSVTDTFVISNSQPVISDTEGRLTSQTCYENTPCTYDFASDCSDVDTNDALNYTYGAGTEASCFSMNYQTGLVTLNCQYENQSGSYDTIFIVTDTSGITDSSTKNFTIIAVNDTPVLATISDQSLTEDTYYVYTATATDEENDPFSFRDNTTLFNINPNGTIAFTPNQTDVGVHYVNISVNDTYGNVGSQVVKFTISNVNDAPIFNYTCQNQTNVTEGETYLCKVNATDEDGDTLTYSSNLTWFNMSTSGYISFKANETMVGLNWINITVADTSNAKDSKIINLTVINVNDVPYFTNISNFSSYPGYEFIYDINASDDDLMNVYSDNLTFAINYTHLNDSTSTLVRLNATTGVINFTASNEDTGTFWYNLTVNDSAGAMDSEIINITIRSNVPPDINATINHNITEDIRYYFNFTKNVTDSDGDSITFMDNTTMFIINITTGEVNFTANDSYVGTNWVRITVLDPWGGSDYQDINFTVYNVEDIPVLISIGNKTATEDSAFYYDVNATDEDLNIPGTTEILYFIDNTTLFDIDPSTGIISFTPNNTDVGIHWINVSVNDTLGKTSSEVFNITISAFNDPPNLTKVGNHTLTTGNLWFIDINATDEEDSPNLPENGNLTFKINITTLFTINATNGTIFYTPNVSDVGTYWINVSVNDTLGKTSSEVFNITIRETNLAPSIIDAVCTPSSNIANFRENQSQLFRVFVTDGNNDPLTYNWTINGLVWNTTSTTGSGTVSSSWTWISNFTSEGTYNLTVLVSDGNLTDSHYWNVTINHTNSPPEFYANMTNISWNEDTSYSNLDLDSHFLDLDNQSNLSFTYTQMNETGSIINTSQITVSINNVSHIVTLTPTANWYGIEMIRFMANDSEYVAYSNNITLNVTDVDENVVTTTGGGGGGGGGGARYTAIDIIHPGSVSLFAGQRIITPVIIRNTGTTTLVGINLTTMTSSTDITTRLSETYITSLNAKEEKQVNLEILVSEETEEGMREIRVEADVTNPDIKDSVKFFASLVEFGLENKTIVLEKIRYLKEQLNENPECLELNEVVEAAQIALENKDYAEAIKLTTEAIQSCKDIVSGSQGRRVYEAPKSNETKYYILGLEALVMIIVFSSLYYYYKRRKIKKGKR